MWGSGRACSPAPAESRATARACIPRVGGVGPVAGDAVNPSMEAWPRHPCRVHPRNRTHPAFDRFPRSVGTSFCFGRCRPWSTRMPEEPAFAFVFFFVIFPRCAGNCPWPGGWVGWGREPHGPEACLGRVGQDARPWPCRARRTAHTSKRRSSLHGRTCSAPQPTHPPGHPQRTSKQPPRRGRRPMAGLSPEPWHARRQAHPEPPPCACSPVSCP